MLKSHTKTSKTVPKSWPTAGEYTEALQHPRLCFSDPELQTGQVDKKLMGMPCGSDGNAAIVFELRCASNIYAIKCFKRAVSDRQQHYDELSQCLAKISSSYLIHFSYIHNIIRVRNEVFPIVRMEWVNSEQLGQFVEQSILQRNSLISLANNFRCLVNEMERIGIVHGDLQHGNILVEPSGDLRLIDYDGMCVLPLPSVLPVERGHSNYQHPERLRSGYYKENTDAFAAQVIYLSILAVEADSKLWGDFNNGENLILTSNDFSSPGQTPIWKRLHQSPDSEVRRLTTQLEQECRGSVSTVASLATLFSSIAPPTSTAPPTASVPATPWYQQQRSPSSSQSPSSASPAVTPNTPAPSVSTPSTSGSVVPNPSPTATRSQPVTPPPLTITASPGVRPRQPASHPTTIISPVSPWLSAPTATPPIPAQAQWEDNASRNLRLIIIGVGLIALLVAAGVIFLMPRFFPLQQGSTELPHAVNTVK